MILGVIMLAGVSLTARLAGMEAHDRELMNCMLTYSLLVSLSIHQLVQHGSRPAMYLTCSMRKADRLMPFSLRKLFYYACGRSRSLWSFSLVFRSALIYQILCLWFSLILIVVWMEMVYLTALKDYKGIVLAFTIS